MRYKLKVAAVTAVTALGTMGGILTTTAAADGPGGYGGSCYGNGTSTQQSCYGQDPLAMGCNADAITVGTINSDEGTVDLRYSQACGAAWARLSNAPGFPWRSISWFVQNGNGQWQSYGFNTYDYQSGWTNMVDASSGYIQAGNDQRVTGWYQEPGGNGPLS